ncbi:uncharacterized protein LOC124118206 [Haliotis rufescens]|uniref:uncharacterized protein LOC124118206 n=1 Tax=Haliotis rufescens TaxID=6454 RepID=UPI001EB00CAD|nr:uncharacterized protein LOC124118206 [Haliotis rufescens]
MKWSHIVLILTVLVVGLMSSSLPADDEDSPDDLQGSGSGEGETPGESEGVGWLFYLMIGSGSAAGFIIVVAIVVFIHRLRKPQEAQPEKPLVKSQKSNKVHV